jgi:hypothetical protein
MDMWGVSETLIPFAKLQLVLNLLGRIVWSIRIVLLATASTKSLFVGIFPRVVQTNALEGENAYFTTMWAVVSKVA